MRETLRLLLSGILTWLFLKTCTAETLKTSNSCLTTDVGVLKLTCNPGEMIHVISFLYQTASDCNTVDGDCQVLQQSSDDGMLLSCNGKQICDETISNSKTKNECNHTTPVYVTITYGCVSESPLDVCTNTSQTFEQQVYLISPDYLKRNDDFPLTPCECGISGSDISVEILELNVLFFSENRANITLIEDSGSWSSSPLPNFLQYNKLLITQTENVRLFYHARQKTGQHMWLRLQGYADITVICNKGNPKTYAPVTLTPSTPETSTPETSVSVYVTPTIPKRASQGNNEAVIVGVLTSILTVMVIIAVLLLLYLYRIRKQGDKEPDDAVIYVNTQNPNDNMNETESSAYAELNTGNTLATNQYEDLRQSQTYQQEVNEYLEPVASISHREDEIRREISSGIEIVDGTSTGSVDGSLPFLGGDLKTRSDCDRENVDVFNTSIYENKDQFGISGAAEREQGINDGNLIYSNDHTRDQFDEYESPITQGGNFNEKHDRHKMKVPADYLDMLNTIGRGSHVMNHFNNADSEITRGKVETSCQPMGRNCDKTNIAGDCIEMKNIPDRAIQMIDSSPQNDCQKGDTKYLELDDEREDYFV